MSVKPCRISRLEGPAKLNAARCPVTFTRAQSSPHNALSRSSSRNTPAEPPVRHRPRLYRYDPRSWYYNQAGYYPSYGSGYWVPRAEMRYRYRYRYVGPKYRYYPAWGYGVGSYGRWW